MKDAGSGVGTPGMEALRGLLDGLPDAVHLYDEGWRWVYMNPAAARWLRSAGADPEALLGQRLWDVMRLDEAVRAAAEQAVAEGRETVVETPFPRLGNSWWETRIIPVPGGVASFSRDVTERRRAEEGRRALADASAVLSASLDPEEVLAELAGLAVHAMADYAVSYLLDESAGVLRRVGAAHRSDLGGDLLRPLMDRPIPLDSDHGVAQVVRSGEARLAPSVTDEQMRRSAQGAEHLAALQRIAPASAIIVPLRARGRTLGAFTVATVHRDTPPYREDDLPLVQELAARAALAFDNARLLHESQAASRAKSQFLATISHELRTPLTAILGYADLMDAGLTGPLTEGQRSHVRRIMMSARHLVGVIEQILTFSRTEAGREAVQLEEVDLVALMHDTAALLEPQAFERGLEIEVRAGEEEASATTDPGKVRQILLNLAGNAVKFTEKGGVTLELAGGVDTWRLVVRDTGPGIDPADAERIFEPFTQLDASDTRARGGAGLGLAVCRRLARLLDGDVTLQSESGRGSTFILTLPRQGP